MASATKSPSLDKALVFAGLFTATFIIAGGYLFRESLAWMWKHWLSSEEYSHGAIIPLVAAYLIWGKLDKFTHPTRSHNVLGLLLFIVGLGAFLITDLATIYVGVLLAFLLCIYGFSVSLLGYRNTKEIRAPLLMLIFMVPMPTFINNNLSAELQLISSEIGVAFIRLFDISVYLEGNVIDLGSYKLQVVDACSGLRYLYPLVALGFILAYMCQIKMWQKVVVFLSTIPITVIMNSIRIGAIGVSVEYWGPEMAEGLLHDIEGWFIFMTSLFVVLVELIIILRLSGDRRQLKEVLLAVSGPEHFPRLNLGASLRYVVIALSLLLAMVVYVENRETEEEVIPERIRFNHFPLFIGEWQGNPRVMEQYYIDELKFDDYILADYTNGSERLNFYVAYYSSQRKGGSAHSPRSCIPGGGWQIKSLEQVHIGELYFNSQKLIVNRLRIQKGNQKQAVYYWFNQRGRLLTNEYAVKWYLFQDALLENRTDGALIRLSVPLEANEGFDDADRIVEQFLSEALIRMSGFIPSSDLG